MAQQTLPAFNYAGLDSIGNRLNELKLEEGKKTLVSFLDEIPGMQNPPFVYCKVHWNSEMGDNGRIYQCHGGSCCQQVTWQKGWGNEPGKFEVNKARTRYFIPLVHYCQDETNPAQMKAEVKYLNLTWSAYDILVKTLQNTTEGLNFFERDITLESGKINGATVYQLHKGESKAQWRQNAVFKQQVEEQLPEVAQKLLNSMPKLYTEAEFLEMKPQLDAKVQAALSSHNQTTQTASAGFGTPQGQIGALPVPQAQPAQTVYTQPQVNVPIQPQANVPVQPQPATAIQPQEVVQPQPEQQVEVTVEQAPQVEIPSVQLEFDPTKVLK